VGRRTGCVRSVVPPRHALFASARVWSFSACPARLSCPPVSFLSVVCPCAGVVGQGAGASAGHTDTQEKSRERGRTLRRITEDFPRGANGNKKPKLSRFLAENFEDSWRRIAINAPCWFNSTLEGMAFRFPNIPSADLHNACLCAPYRLFLVLHGCFEFEYAELSRQSICSFFWFCRANGHSAGEGLACAIGRRHRERD